LVAKPLAHKAYNKLTGHRKSYDTRNKSQAGKRNGSKKKFNTFGHVV